MQEYSMPKSNEWKDHIEHIENFAMEAPPSVFGLHTNATMAKNSREVDKVRRKIKFLICRFILYDFS